MVLGVAHVMNEFLPLFLAWRQNPRSPFPFKCWQEDAVENRSQWEKKRIRYDGEERDC